MLRRYNSGQEWSLPKHSSSFFSLQPFNIEIPCSYFGWRVNENSILHRVIHFSFSHVLDFYHLSTFLVSIGSKMFVTGGCQGSCYRAIRLHVAELFHNATDEVWCFCPMTLTCKPGPAMLKPRTMHTAVTCLDRVYVIGGRTKGPRGKAPSLLEVRVFLIGITFH